MRFNKFFTQNPLFADIVQSIVVKPRPPAAMAARGSKGASHRKIFREYGPTNARIRHGANNVAIGGTVVDTEPLERPMLVKEEIQGRGMPGKGTKGAPIYAWDPQKGEGGQAYGAFARYLEMEPGIRSLVAVAAIDGMPQYERISKLSRKWSWVARATAYDQWREKNERHKRTRDKREAGYRQAALGKKMQQVAMTALEAGTVQVENVGDVVRLADSGTRIERLAMGDSTDNVATVNRFEWNAPLPAWAPKELKQLEAAGVNNNDQEEGAGGHAGGRQLPDEARPDAAGSEVHK